MKKKRVIMSATSDLVGDQRVARIAGSLHANGYDVLVIGRKLSRSHSLEEKPYRQKRLNLLFKKGKLFYLFFNIRLFWVLMFSRVDILNANDLDTMLANYMVSRLRGKKIVYDSHEYFTEVPELIGRNFSRKVWLWLEGRTFPKIKHRYTVSAPIAEEYEKKYGGKVGLIRNLPVSADAKLTRNEPGKRMIYQGACNLGRGVDLLISMMEFLPDYELVIAGKGDMIPQLKKQAENMPNVKFLGMLKPNDLAEETAKCSIGFSLEEDLGENYHYGLPNKLFDYIRAGVPVVVSELREMAKVVRAHEVGVVISNDKRAAEEVANVVRRILQSKEEWSRYHENCLKASKELNWEKEEQKLLAIYKQAIEA